MSDPHEPDPDAPEGEEGHESHTLENVKHGTEAGLEIAKGVKELADGHAAGGTASLLKGVGGGLETAGHLVHDEDVQEGLEVAATVAELAAEAVEVGHEIFGGGHGSDEHGSDDHGAGEAAGHGAGSDDAASHGASSDSGGSHGASSDSGGSHGGGSSSTLAENSQQAREFREFVSGTSHHVMARFENSELTGDELDILSVRGTERISQLFEFEIHCLGAIGTDAPIAGEDLIGKAASLVFYQTNAELRRVEGMVSHAREHAEYGYDRPHLILTLVPRAYPASQFETLDVFLDMAVPNIVDQVLGASRIASGEDFDISELCERSSTSEDDNASKDYACVEYTVQYKESNLAFVQRLCEHLGVFYVFDAEGMMVFGDSNSVFTELERTPNVQYLPENTGTWTDRVASLELITSNLPARYIMRDYNWRNPGVDMMGEADVIEDGVGQIVEYGGHFKSPEQGTAMAEVRAEELRATRYVYAGHGTSPSFTAGGTFMLGGHPFGDLPLLLTEVVHEYEATVGDDGGKYRNTFRSIASETAYRPPRLTPKPRVDGAITGIIQGGSGTEFGEIDGQGRYRVKFMFDTAERGEGQASRAVRMAQPSAGGSQGFSFPLRAGVEVILSCIDGDPDRPIITGAVPNPAQPSPTTGNNPNHNMIRTSKNQIDIDDDEARVKISSDGHGAELQLGTPNEPNEGYILKTTADGVGTAGKLIGTTSPLISTLSEIRLSSANKNIIAAAGPPDPMSGFAKFKKWSSAALDFASGAAAAADAGMGFVKGIADGAQATATKQANSAQDQVITDTLGDDPANKYDKDNNTHQVTTADGTSITVTETEDQFRKRKYTEAMAERQRQGAAAAANGDAAGSAALLADPPAAVAAADTVDLPFGYHLSGSAAKDVSAALDGASKNGIYAGAKSILGTATAIRDTSKKLKDLKKTISAMGGLWGTGFDATAKALEAKEYITSQWWVGQYKLSPSSNGNRKGHAAPPIAQPYHILGSTNSTVAYADDTAYVFSTTTGIYGSKTLGLRSALTVQVSSGRDLELATHYLYTTVDNDSDTLIKGKVNSKVVKEAKYLYEDTLKTTVKDKINLESKEKKIEVKAKTGWILDGGDKIDTKAKKVKHVSSEKAYQIQSKSDFWVKATKDAKINSDTHALAHGKKKFTGKSDKGGIEATTSKTKIWQQSSQMLMQSSKVKVTTSKFEVNAKSTVILKGGGKKIQLGSGKVKLA